MLGYVGCTDSALNTLSVAGFLANPSAPHLLVERHSILALLITERLVALHSVFLSFHHLTLLPRGAIILCRIALLLQSTRAGASKAPTQNWEADPEQGVSICPPPFRWGFSSYLVVSLIPSVQLNIWQITRILLSLSSFKSLANIHPSGLVSLFEALPPNSFQNCGILTDLRWSR